MRSSLAKLESRDCETDNEWLKMNGDREMLRKFSKQLLSIAVSAATLLAPITRVQAEDVEESRRPASVQVPLSERQEKIIRDGVFDTAVRISKLVKTHKDFERYYLSQMMPADRATFAKRLTEFPEGKLPTLYNNRGELVVEYGAGQEQLKMRVRWPDVRKPIYFINGIEFVYNPEKPLAPQVDFLVQKMMARKIVSIWSLLEDSAIAEDGGDILGPALDKVTNHVSPSTAATAARGATAGATAAEAAAAAAEKKSFRARLAGKIPKIKISNLMTVVIAGAVLPKVYDVGGSGLLDVVSNYYCAGLDHAGQVGLMRMCLDWRKAQFELKKKGNPNGSLTKEAAVMARFEIEEFPNSCPDNDDGKPRILDGKVRATGYDENNKKSYTGPWANMRMTWNAAGIPLSLIVTPIDMNPAKPITDPDSVHRIVMSLSFDKDGFLIGTTVPNDQWNGANSNLLDSPTKTLSVDKIMTPVESAKYEKSKDVLFTSLIKARSCIVATAQKAVSENQSPVKAPPAGTAPAGALPSVAPVPVVQ